MNFRYGLVGLVSLVLSVGASACEFSFGQGSIEPPTVTTTLVDPPSPAATPELDSLVLFGSGLLSAAAYVRRRRTLR